MARAGLEIPSTSTVDRLIRSQENLGPAIHFEVDTTPLWKGILGS
jgi:hypothetical protein